MVAWPYKALISSTKLAQMVENLLVHDHRADGTQGDPIGALTTPDYLTGANVTLPLGTATSVGSLAVPTLKRPAVLNLVFSFSPNSATSGAFTYAISNDARVIGNVVAPRIPHGPFAVMQAFPLVVPMNAGAADTIDFTMTAATVAGSGRLFAWVQG